ncbi:GspMb/PilO family protein [Paenibacillus glycanilyticus]|uniref:GspMb/PilO family protein n=1 Tax=Paenibacillus glycanilyticus TaxID=126569 RepID=UPI00203F89F0|nr:GspMb/PilO family protein [Paenibacillus glycanilyticus]MCM3627154.1 GspMb/PilO family protein [Paenibacillus glycanilyticus]
MDNTKNRSLGLIIMMLLFLVLLLLYVALLQPSSSKLSDQKELANQTEMQLNALQASVNKQNDGSSLPERDIQAALPLWDNSEQLVVTIKSLSQRTGAKVNSATMDLPGDNKLNAFTGVSDPLYPTVKEVNVHVSLLGTYAQVKGWMSQLQQQQRLIVVNAFTLQQTDSGINTAELSFTAYFDPSYEQMLKDPILPAKAD